MPVRNGMGQDADAVGCRRLDKQEPPRRGPTEEFRGFLAGFVKGLPLHAPSDITGREAVHLLLIRSGGITGRITLILARAAEMAIRKGIESINVQGVELASRDLDLSPPLLG